MKILSKSPTQTVKLGYQIGQCLMVGDVVGLAGELGTGKTTLTKGIARGVGVGNSDSVTSPSFVLIKEYKGKITLYHIDLYRLDDLREVERLGYEEYLYGDGVTVIEWAQKIESLLPKDYLRIELYIRNENERSIDLIPFGRRYRELIRTINLE